MTTARAVRRAMLPVLLGLEVVLAALAVAGVIVGVVAGCVDRRWRLLRIASMAVAYAGVEWCSLIMLLGVWLLTPVRGRAWAERATMRVLKWALGRTLCAAERTLGFRIETTNEPPDGRPLSEQGPVLVLARHGGVGDSIALVWLLVERYRRRPRIVLKEILVWEPLAHVVLHRLGACLLPSSRRRRAGRKLLGEFAASLEPGDALLLFPEGRNWTPGRRRESLRWLRSAHAPPHARKAELMEHVLPPRSGGVSACLDARPDLPVAMFAHTGLDTITSARQLWSALPFRSPMTVRWWPSLPPPSGRSERAAWLIREWAIVDEWIDARRSEVDERGVHERART